MPQDTYPKILYLQTPNFLISQDVEDEEQEQKLLSEGFTSSPPKDSPFNKE